MTLADAKPLDRCTPQARRGLDLMRRIRDGIESANRGKHAAEQVEQVVLSPRIGDMIRTTWAEMAPGHPLPTDFAGVPFVIGDTQGAGFLFLRDYTPWEKRKALADGMVLYGTKKVVATGDV